MMKKITLETMMSLKKNFVMTDFVLYDELYLKLSWKWLNDKEIKLLTNTPDFNKEQQQKWFLSLASAKNYYIRGVSHNGSKIGVVGLKHITSTQAEYWGYIGEKKFWGKGIGKEMIYHIIEVAKFKKLEIVYLKVIKSNKRAILLYKKVGFEIIKSKSTLSELHMEYKLDNF